MAALGIRPLTDEETTVRLNVGGAYVDDVPRSALLQASNLFVATLSAIIVAMWGKTLPRDAAGRLVVDVSPEQVQQIASTLWEEFRAGPSPHLSWVRCLFPGAVFPPFKRCPWWGEARCWGPVIAQFYIDCLGVEVPESLTRYTLYTGHLGTAFRQSRSTPNVMILRPPSLWFG